MRIAQELIDELVAHAREEAPNECCGLLAGTGDEVTSLLRGFNLYESPLRFEVRDMPKLLARIEADELEHLATYHSHTRSPAYPSQTDINLAQWWPGLVWVICSLEDPDAPAVRAFRMDGGEVEEVELRIG